MKNRTHEITAKEIVKLLEGMSAKEAVAVLRLAMELINLNSYVSVKDKFTELPNVFCS